MESLLTHTPHTGKEAGLLPLPMRKWGFASNEPNQYRVTSAAGESKPVSATTAYEAFLKSGYQDAILIERLLHLDEVVVEEKELRPEAASSKLSAPEKAEDDPLREIYLRKTPVISAGDLDSLMRTLQEMAMQVTGVPLPEATETGAPSSAAAGIDVHGEGFDEIIPSANPSVPAAPIKHAEPKAEPATPAAAAPPPPPAPERELSADEIAKLLEGK